MPHDVPDSRRTAKRRLFRNKLAAASADERYLYLRALAKDTLTLATLASKASSSPWNLRVCNGFAPGMGIFVGACFCSEPSNPVWPGRDRFFLAWPAITPVVCSALALNGFFSPEHVARLVDTAVRTGDHDAIPGLEAAGGNPEEILLRALESAQESLRSKRRWKGFFETDGSRSWVDRDWLDFPWDWRTCVVAEPAVDGIERLRTSARDGAVPPGLIVVLPVDGGDANVAAAIWQDCGWETMVVSENDYLGCYDAFSTPVAHHPLVVLFDLGKADRNTRIFHAARESRLLGNLPDEQFGAIIDASLDW